MEIYVAPPRGKKEKEACLFWLNHFGHEVIWLDLRRKVKGPLLLCGGADIGKDPERDKKELLSIGTKIVAKAKKVFNPAFDITPYNLISGIVTEKGIIKKPDKAKILKF